MSISSIGINDYLNNALSSSSSSQATSLNVSDAAASSGTDQTSANTLEIAGNNSSLSNAITQALAQLSGNTDLSSLLTPDSQQSSSDFMSSLLASLPGLSESGASSTDLLSSLYGYSSGQTSVPVTLDQSSSTIKLQTAIQNLITQLDSNSGTSELFGSSSDSNPLSGLGNLQQSFNNLITASGGDPSQASLQSFLKTIAANIQSSMSIGTLLDTSA